MRPPVPLDYPKLLPLVWVVLALLSFFLPGGEPGLFVFAAIAGSWIGFVIPGGFSSPGTALVPTLVVGFGCMLVLGIALRHRRFPRRRMLFLFVAATALVMAVLLVQVGWVDRAVAKAGSLWPYLVASALAGWTVAAVVALVWGTAALLHGGRGRRGE